jgi:hypothetical protein
MMALVLVASALGPSALFGQQASAGDQNAAVLAAPAAAVEPAAAVAAVEAPPTRAASPILLALEPAPFAWAVVPAPGVALPQDRVRAGPNIAMMAVGGAALVVGLVIGGDGGYIMAAAGGVIGLIGLYRYLR